MTSSSTGPAAALPSDGRRPRTVPRVRLAAALPYTAYGAAWLAAVAVLAARGRGSDLVLAAAALLTMAVLVSLVLLITWHREPPALPRADRSVKLQVAFLAALVGFSFVRFGPPAVSHATGFGYLPGSAYAIVVFLLPLAAVVALGARGGELGLRLTGTAMLVTVAMVALRAGMLLPEILGGAGPRIVHDGLVALLLTTAPEDLTFRGIIQTRLARLLGTPWGIVVTALAFGMWHFGINVSATGDLALAAARSVVLQATIGLAYGTAMARTGSVVPGALAHAAFNAG